MPELTDSPIFEEDVSPSEEDTPPPETEFKPEPDEQIGQDEQSDA